MNGATRRVLNPIKSDRLNLWPLDVGIVPVEVPIAERDERKPAGPDPSNRNNHTSLWHYPFQQLKPSKSSPASPKPPICATLKA